MSPSGERESRRETSLSLTTLIIGSMSSAAAAVVVHEIWRAGAILGAAVTPVLMALFAEALRRPAERITVRSRRTPAGRAPLSDRSMPRDAPGETIRIYRSRPRWRLAVVTGLAAFVLGAGGLTVSEALLQRSVADRDVGTTLFDSAPQHRSASPNESEPPWRSSAPASQAGRDNRRPPGTRYRRSRGEPSSRSEKRTAAPTPTPTATPSPSPTQPPPTPIPMPSATPQPTPFEPAQTGARR